MQPDAYRFSRLMYILESAFEYFISLLVGGAYLAMLTAEIGLSDSLTGILGSITALAGLAQISTLFLTNPRSLKRFLLLFSLINQLCFALLYFVPFFEVSRLTKTVIFILLLLAGQTLYHVACAPKIGFFMAMVPDGIRGRFTANKEIVSLIGGSVFTFIMGTLVDYLHAQGNRKSALVLCGITLLFLTLLHTLTLLLSKEKPTPRVPRRSLRGMLGEMLGDKQLRRVILLSCLWNAVFYCSTPFYGSYQIKELGFSMNFIAVLSAMYTLFRSLASRPLGRYADRFSFVKMLRLCYVPLLLSFTIQIFTVPSNGRLFYTLYYVLQAIAMAGINSGEINLVYERVRPENRLYALALKNTLAGLVGFLSTLLVSKLVDRIQASGNLFLGIHVYAQQIVSAIATLGTILIIVYLHLAFKNTPTLTPDT